MTVMKKVAIVLFFGLGAGYPFAACAQLAPQAFVGNNALEYNFLWYKPVDAHEKITLFNFTTFTIDYQDKARNVSEIYQVGIYNFTTSWGLAGGGRFVGGVFVPLVALSYQKATPTLYFNLFPSAQFVPGTRTLNYSLFGLLFYRPPLTDTWKAFNQLTFEPLFQGNEHLYSYQQVRIGLEYKKLFQFGVGVNFEQTGVAFTFRQNYGLFLRKEFN